MSLLPEQADYLEHVQAYFLAFRGDGVALSPLDAALLKRWREEGVPYSVVCRGIRKAAETLLRDAPQGARLRTLRSCRSAVEREFLRYQGMSAGKTAEPAQAGEAPESYAQKRLSKARKLLAKALAEAPTPVHQKALRRALAILEQAAADPQEVARLVSRADDALAVGYVREMPFAERRSLLRQARAAAGPKPEGASRRARKDALRAHLVALARARGNLVALA
jgi:hypothetical protein